jgi:hypothetical protein
MNAGFLITVAGWLAGLALSAVTVSITVRVARAGRKWARWVFPPLVYGCATVVCFTVLGVIGPLLGSVLAVAPFTAAAWWLLDTWRRLAARLEDDEDGTAAGKAARRVASGAARQLREALRAAWADGFFIVRSAAGWLGLLDRGCGEDYVPAATSPAATAYLPGDATPTRPVPAYREPRPAAPAPAAPPGDGSALANVHADLAAAGMTIPPLWAALCAAVSEFEPETDEELLMHTAGEAAGILAYAEAVRARAETLLTVIGLDPAYVLGHHQFADEFADVAEAAAQVNAMFHAIYGALREWADEHPNGMPWKARQFLQGGEEAGGEAAA